MVFDSSFVIANKNSQLSVQHICFEIIQWYSNYQCWSIFFLVYLSPCHPINIGLILALNYPHFVAYTSLNILFTKLFGQLFISHFMFRILPRPFMKLDSASLSMIIFVHGLHESSCSLKLLGSEFPDVQSQYYYFTVGRRLL
ncbi:hypothetical protein BDQ17DRAFT_1334639 [Cyathus striatus]|nr:hypothetical protein BDQ17DRAFT_1334639 [Cyathus striatus]